MATVSSLSDWKQGVGVIKERGRPTGEEQVGVVAEGEQIRRT